MNSGNAGWSTRNTRFIAPIPSDLATHYSANIRTEADLRTPNLQRSKEVNCEFIDRCAFMEYIDKAEPLSANSVRATYCGNDKYGCARYGLYQVFADDDVPVYLWPNDEEEALEMIKAGSRSKGRG